MRRLPLLALRKENTPKLSLKISFGRRYVGKSTPLVATSRNMTSLKKVLSLTIILTSFGHEDMIPF